MKIATPPRTARARRRPARRAGHELIRPATDPAHRLSLKGRSRLVRGEGRPLFLNDWLRAVFIHYEVDARVLQRQVPFELDLRHGRAYVSLVAFTMCRLRPPVGERLGGILLAPVATHGFLNVRTYVRLDGEPGIYFIAEWLPNRLSVLLGPRAFGLPYRFGRLVYHHDHERGLLEGTVAPGTGRGRIRYRARIDPGVPYRPCDPGSLAAFLLERYSAFTQRGQVRRRFRVWHPPWPQVSLRASVEEDGPLYETGPWYDCARYVGANYSPGVQDVWVGRPTRLR